MFMKIAATITYPVWVNQESDDPAFRRYKNLDLRDRLLDGSFYDHLQHAFYDETDHTGQVVKLVDRRPSAQYRLPRMVARWCSRKLFAGRHVPKLRHDDKAKAKELNTLLVRSKFFAAMKDAVLNGSVGSVAMTFRIDEADDRVAFSVWRAKYCKPSFDDMGELSQLRVQYTTTGAAFIALGYPESESDCKPTGVYWFIRDFLPTGEITYKPVKREDWDPINGFSATLKAARRELEPWPQMTFGHDLKFVCGHWFRNMPGGKGEDGSCTFEDAIPCSIELDYTFSQVGRGVRYNCAPTPVIIGDMINDYTAGTLSHIQLRAGYKEADNGQTVNAGDAKLLEMSGDGVKASLDMIDKLRNYALEQISASRKDPDKMKAPMSGRAMEYLDEDSEDLVHDLRSAYGDHGALPLLRKIAVAAGIMDAEVGTLRLQWPRAFLPTPDEVLSLVQALQIALDPMKMATPANPGSPGKKPASAAGSYTEAVPPTPSTPPEEDHQLLTIDEARAYLKINLDIDAYVEELAESEEDDVDESLTPPNEPTPNAPPPLPLDVNPPDPGQGDEPTADDDDLAGAPQGSFGGRLTVDA